MQPVRRLTLIILTADAERLRGALMLAMGAAALGRPARLFLQDEAVALLKAPITAARDARHRAAGLPTLAELIEEALAMEIGLIACQSGLALAGMDARDLPSGVTVGGPMSVMADAAEDQLSIV